MRRWAAVLLVASLTVFLTCEDARAATCGDWVDAMKYAMGDEVKRRVLRDVGSCYNLDVVDELDDRSSSRLERLLDADKGHRDDADQGQQGLRGRRAR